MDAEFLQSLVGLGAIPVVIAIVNGIKGLFPGKKWYWVASCGVSVGLQFLLIPALGNIFSAELAAKAVINGVVLGLAASGLYSVGTTLRSKENTPQ